MYLRCIYIVFIKYFQIMYSLLNYINFSNNVLDTGIVPWQYTLFSIKVHVRVLMPIITLYTLRSIDRLLYQPILFSITGHYPEYCIPQAGKTFHYHN